jgi:hypothetical protein
MSALDHALRWIEQAWVEMGSKFDARLVPVARFMSLDVDDMAYPFKNEVLEAWFLKDGILVEDLGAKISRVPFIAFSIDDDNYSMNIQVYWASRCGYGFQITFEPNGEVLSQKMRWVS